MNKIILATFAFFATTRFAFADFKCSVNGQDFACMEYLPHILTMIFVFIPFISLVFFVFWLWMLIDAIKNEEENKVVWVLVIVFLSFLGALIYLFAVKIQRKNNNYSQGFIKDVNKESKKSNEKTSDDNGKQ